MGQTCTIANRAYTIIGVLPPGFRGVTNQRSDIWLPLETAIDDVFPVSHAGYSVLENPGYRWVRLVARLVGGASVEATEPVLARSVREADGEFSDLRLVSLREERFRRGYLPQVVRWGGFASLLVLLAACANFGSLLMLRGLGRQSEMAIELSLGASRWQLVRRVAVECLVLALAGTVLAQLVGFALSNALSRSVFGEGILLTRLMQPRLLLFSAGVGLAATVLAGVFPVMDCLRMSIPDILRLSAVTSTRWMGGLRTALVIGQIAFAGLSLVGAILFFRSYAGAAGLDKGFDTRDVIVAEMQSLQNLDLGADEALSRVRSLSSRLDSLAGLKGVAIGSSVPFEAGLSTFCKADPEQNPDARGTMVFVDIVSSGYMELLDIPLLAGRDFAATDTDASPPVAIIDASLARELWRDQSALGHCISLSGIGSTCTRVVGVMADMRRIGQPSTRKVHLPVSQAGLHGRPEWARVVFAKTSAGVTVSSVLDAIRRFSPGVNIRVNTLDSLIEMDSRPWKQGLVLLGAMSLLAALVAMIGMYSHLAFWVSGHRRELAVRMTLGLSQWRTMWIVIRRGLIVAAVGGGIGVGTAGAFYQVMRRLLYGVAAYDPWSLTAAQFSLLVLALTAAIIPGILAVRTSPAQLLKTD